MFGIAGRFPLAAAPAAVLVAAALIWTVPTAIAHADAPLVYPGMRINQGTQSCTLGFVDPGARIGLTAGHCALDSDGPVYDDSGNRVGTADIAHFEPTPQDKSFAEQPPSTTRALPFTRAYQSTTCFPTALSWNPTQKSCRQSACRYAVAVLPPGKRVGSSSRPLTASWSSTGFPPTTVTPAVRSMPSPSPTARRSWGLPPKC